MIVYRIRYAVDDFFWYAAPDEWVADHLHTFDGHSVRDSWQVPPMFIDHPDRPEPDLASANYAPDPIVASAGHEFLARELGDAVEFLPFDPVFPDRWLANVIHLADCLDEDRSDWRIGRSTGERISVNRFALRSTVLRSLKAPVFKIPHFPTGSLYCTDGFRERFDESDLTGLLFEQIWQER